MNHLITDDMLDDAAQALKGHRVRRGRCSCGSTTSVERHMAEVVADTVAPTLVAEMMDLLAQLGRRLDEVETDYRQLAKDLRSGIDRHE